MADAAEVDAADRAWLASLLGCVMALGMVATLCAWFGLGALAFCSDVPVFAITLALVSVPAVHWVGLALARCQPTTNRCVLGWVILAVYAGVGAGVVVTVVGREVAIKAGL